MIHSRPGFASRTNDTVPAKLNTDMVPALHRKSSKESTTLKTNGPSFEAMLEAHKHEHAQHQATAPEILVNPTPSDPPHVIEPGK